MKLKTGGGFLATCGLKAQDVIDCVIFFFPWYQTGSVDMLVKQMSWHNCPHEGTPEGMKRDTSVYFSLFLEDRGREDSRVLRRGRVGTISQA